MARQVGNGFTIHLTSSLRAGVAGLEKLFAQGCVLTTTWFDLRAETIVNESPNSSVTRILHFTLKDATRVELKVMAWASDHERESEGQSEEREWFPCHAYVERDQRMLAYENHCDPKRHPWARQPGFDKPLPGATWRIPTLEEFATCTTAIVTGDESAFLKVYYADLIDWSALNGDLRDKTGWVSRTLQKAA